MKTVNWSVDTLNSPIRPLLAVSYAPARTSAITAGNCLPFTGSSLHPPVARVRARAPPFQRYGTATV